MRVKMMFQCWESAWEMQLTCIEFARHVLGLEGANSAELTPETKYPIIDIMRDQIDVEDMGEHFAWGFIRLS